MNFQKAQRPSLELSRFQFRAAAARRAAPLAVALSLSSLLTFAPRLALAASSQSSRFSNGALSGGDDSNLTSSSSPRAQLIASNALGYDSNFEPGSETPNYHLIPEGRLVAQAEGDDAYDPFADYSEFEETADEEEDLNFFRNGRLLTVGFLGGYRGWTGTLGSLYSSGPSFGLYLCYFFDLRFALQIGYVTNSTTLHVPARTNSIAIDGNISLDQPLRGWRYLADLPHHHGQREQ